MKYAAFLTITIGALLAASVGLRAQREHTFVDLMSRPRWQVESSHPLKLSDVRQWGGEPSVDREYGVKSVEIRTYQEGSEKAQAVVEEAPDPSSAYGLFTFYQNENMVPVEGMKLAVMGPQQGYLARGTAFVRVPRPAKMPDKDFHDLLLSIGGDSPSEQSMALLPPPLPVQGLIPCSEKYVFGPIAAGRALSFFRTDLVGFQQGAELQSAAYREGGQRVNFYLISYPTSQIAKLRFRALTHLLGINQASGPGSLFGELKGTYVLLVQNATSQKLASRLMDRLSISQQVSWNAPKPGKPIVTQMLQLLIGNMLLILVLVGMAVFAGILLFISRRLAARWFPNSDWARGYEDSIIRLNLK